MDNEGLRTLLRQQDGVVSRRQVLALGADKADLERMVRRRELTRVHTGVYVDHTGPLTWCQRAWSAVLYAGPAALYLRSAVASPDPDGPIHVAIDETRRIAELDDVRIHRVVDLKSKARWNQSPPRVKVEENLLELVHRAPSDLDVVRLVTDEVHGRRTTAARLRETLDQRPRMRRRAWLLQVLDDVEHGASSVLEHGYLTRVERAHGLPAPSRQTLRRGLGGLEYRDVEYDDFGLVVELDGRMAHDSWAAGARDAERDLDDRAAGRETVRLRYAQVFEHPCRTSARMVVILRRLGWVGTARRCGPDCELPDECGDQSGA